MMLWQNTHSSAPDEAGESPLKPADLTNATSVLFYFPGHRLATDESRALPDEKASYIRKQMQYMAKILSPVAQHHPFDMCFLSYPNPDFMLDIRRRSNEDADFMAPEFLAFTREHILPLIEKGTKLTFMGFSAGSVVIEMVQRSLRQILYEQGYSPENIRSALSAIVACHICPVSAFCAEQPQDKGHFTTLVFNNQQDSLARKVNPNFNNLLPPSPQQQEASVHMQGKSAIISTNHADLFSVWEDFAKKKEKNDGHNLDTFLRRNSSTPPETTALLERVLRNATTRQQPMDALSLLRELPPIKEKHCFSVAHPNPLALKIEGSLLPPRWQDRVTAPSQKPKELGR